MEAERFVSVPTNFPVSDPEQLWAVSSSLLRWIIVDGAPGQEATR